MKEFKFVGVPVHGPEEDYLLTSDGQFLSMTSLLHRDGAKHITWQEVVAFETSTFEASDVDNDHFAKYKKEYLELNGRVPRVYKVKIKVEVEELSEEDCQTFWETKQQRNC